MGPALQMLGSDYEEEPGTSPVIDDSFIEDDGDFPTSVPLIVRPQEDFANFLRRAIGIGALLADAEALVDAQLGPLPRGATPSTFWAHDLVMSGALSSVRRESGAMVARRLNVPMRRLVDALRNNVLASKLTSARRGLEDLFAKDSAP